MAERFADELVPVKLATFLADIGKELAAANQQLAPNPANPANPAPAHPSPPPFIMQSAEVELHMSLMRSSSTGANANIGGGIAGFNLSAGFTATFGYKAEGSTRIKAIFTQMPAAVAVVGGS